MLLYIALVKSRCSAVGSARGLGPWGRRFDPCHLDQFKDFLRNSRKFQKSLKWEKADVCKITAPAFNFIKFYKILKNAEKISKINFKNYFLS